jgi:S-DNA-T family DNA segregation ATPase FtsK/SpoIIIE
VAKKKSFVIPKIEEPTKKEHTFVSPFFGTKNKDDIVLPTSTMKGNINKRYDDFRKESKYEEDKKDRYKREFNILDSQDIKKMMGSPDEPTPPPIKPTKPVIKPVVEEPLIIPFGLEDQQEESPISVDELNQVFGDYESIELEDEPRIDVTPPHVEAQDAFDPAPSLFEEPIPRKSTVKPSSYVRPSLSLLKKTQRSLASSEDDINQLREIINMTLTNFRIGGEVIDYTHGPTVTLFEIRLDQGVMVNRINSIASNLKMNLAAIDIRIEAPIPGKQTVGIEVPNPVREIVNFGNLIDDDFVTTSKPLEIILGVNLSNERIVADINKMPHGLIAGATGSGKSVCIDTILMSLLLKASPSELKLILIDPKRVGLAAYAKVPHLATPIIHDAKVAAEVLRWTVEEMERRYDKMYVLGVRDVHSYNQKIKGREDEGYEHIPTLVIIIEEMADLMAQAGADVELSVARIAQKARAANIHLMIATQRPSVDVIKGTIKSNIPTRIAMKVSSYTDSMVILDYQGAESLLGNGDMLFVYSGERVKRLQGAFVSEAEIDAVTDYLSRYPQSFLLNQEQMIHSVDRNASMQENDDLFLDVAEYVIEMDYASINKIQQQFNIGYNRASLIFEQLTESGIVSPQNSKTPRKVLMTMAVFLSTYRS